MRGKIPLNETLAPHPTALQEDDLCKLATYGAKAGELSESSESCRTQRNEGGLTPYSLHIRHLQCSYIIRHPQDRETDAISMEEKIFPP